MSPIRPAAAEDLAAIQAIVHAAYAPYIPRIGKPPGPMGDDYAALIAQACVFVCGAPVQGIVVLIDAAGYLLLDNIAVADSARGQGIGRRLMEFADAEAARRGFAELRLYTHALMHENIALYTRAGWTQTHRATENGFDRVFFRKQAIA